ncbi:MAG: hypothetical protein ABSH02_05075 [Candidatus Sulfotelmatobacter sp.]|jgi:hypothetical protein
MLPRMALFVLLSTFVVGGDQPPHVYQPGTITGWSTQHYARAYAIGGRVSSAPGHKKFYELKGVGMTYQLDDCGSFEAGQAVEYRVEGKKVYIHKENGKEHKCGIEGVKADTPTAAPDAQK